MVKKLCYLCWGVCSHENACFRKCDYKHVWMEIEGEKGHLRRIRIADELLYKREEQKLLVLSQNFAICPNSV